MKMKKILLELFTAILVILFIYTPTSKLLKFHAYTRSMRVQPLLPALQTFLIYAVPLSEIVAVILLVIPKTRKAGLYLTLSLLFIFTGYISLIQLNFYGRIPCSCGGIFQRLNWEQHLLLNVFLLLISMAAIWLQKNISRHETHDGKAKSWARL
ncbi:MauE/DoxX family redox-associated membrane protein [Chitinophaga arvensicola]|uniref:Methylamine utilisation protein MauE n=1 Tax=Chitinophaga arvensicola TaxID=29529 RepID=A0A1I0REP3_9BACT|nr:MauE/DoxX family redox-associated membrane protein [Chitinophaga arvensicola]SEW39321.1 Methylamine utilisation protein MauE [Chitinophaga arvensicola]